MYKQNLALNNLRGLIRNINQTTKCLFIFLHIVEFYILSGVQGSINTAGHENENEIDFFLNIDKNVYFGDNLVGVWFWILQIF